MNLHRYLERLADTLRSRRDLALESLRVTPATLGAVFEARVRFYDGSELILAEELEQAGPRNVRRVAYKFQYQQADGALIFRYDNAPHHPQISTFPDHKHLGAQVSEAHAPDLTEVLREIDDWLYPPSTPSV